jgi:hypothetical protein
MAKQNGVFKNKTLKGEAGFGNASDFFETFDSGDGPVVPDGMEEDFAHADSQGLGGYTMNKIELDTLHGGVPVVDSTKR